MKVASTHIATLLSAAIFMIALYCFVADTMTYQLCQLEHNTLNFSDWQGFTEALQSWGGLTEWLALSATEFFAFKYCGPFMYCLPFFVMFLSLLYVGYKLNDSEEQKLSPISFGFVALAVLAQLFSQIDFDYSFQGTVSAALSSAVLAFLSKIHQCQRRNISLLFGILIVVCFNGCFSSVFLLSCIALFGSLKHWLSSIVIPFATFILLHIIIYNIGCSDSLLHQFTPVGYYHPVLEMPIIHWIAWLVYLLWALCIRFLPTIKFLENIYTQIIVCLISVALLLPLTKTLNMDNLRLWRLNHLAFTRNWDEILRLHSSPQSNLVMMNYTNLALANKGQLGDKVFKYYPYTPSALMVSQNESSSVRMLLSDIHYVIGNIAESQKQAFEAMVGNASNCGSQCLRRLIQTNIIQGHYAVAEKYINILSRTRFHMSWSENQRKFLYNDKAVELNHEYGILRKCLSNGVDRFSMYEGWTAQMEDVIESNPSLTTAIEYLGISLLLSKDLDGFKTLIDKYYGTGCLKVLPETFQEAIIALFQKDSSRWKEYNLDAKVLNRYNEYKASFAQARGDKKKMQNFRNTFWYYLMYVK